MTVHATPEAIVRVHDDRQVTRATLLGVCASLKPAPGRQGNSASRTILCYALEGIAPVYRDVALLDLRDHRLPFFDGRTGPEYGDASLNLVASCVERAGALLVSAPAYWCGVSGVFKNFLDTLCGPAYDLPPPAHTIFTGKPVGVLVVGADERSALTGARQAVTILESTGARLVGEPTIVSNPRGGVDGAVLSRALLSLAGELAGHALNGARG